ncbi:hypothetical protein IWZ01DRAFT_523291 [Phyllosticta capitalensis]
MRYGPWDELILNDEDNFDPNQGELEFFEIEENEALRSNRLNPSQVKDWIKSLVPTRELAPQQTARLRCLIGNITPGQSILPFPFDSETLNTIMDNFDLPAGFLDACKHTTTMTSVDLRLNKGSGEVVAGFSKSYFAAAAWSHSIQSNTTSTMVLATNHSIEGLQQAFEKSDRHSFHPLFIPHHIFGRELTFSRTFYKACHQALQTCEGLVGLTDVKKSDEAFFKNFEENVKKMESVAGGIVNWESNVQGLARSLKNELLEAMAKLQLVIKPELQVLGADIEVWICHFAKATEDLAATIPSWRQRTELSLSTYNYILSYRDAKQNARIASASKRDSSSMKSLAVLSVIFVPPSCISIFWACTVPITGLTVIIWILYMRWIDKRNSDEWEMAGGGSKTESDEEQETSTSSDGEQNTRPAHGAHRDIEHGGEKSSDQNFTLREILGLLWHLLRSKTASG